MSPEVIPFPHKEPTPHIPEDLRECVDLVDIIDLAMARWRGYSRHPAMRKLGFANFIVSDCQPLEREPADYLAETGFSDYEAREDARDYTEYEQQRAVLSEWLTHIEIDNVSIHDEVAADFFQGVSVRGEEPLAPEAFRTATQLLVRLFKLRELLATKIGHLEALNSDDFIAVFEYLRDELPK